MKKILLICTLFYGVSFLMPVNAETSWDVLRIHLWSTFPTNDPAVNGKGIANLNTWTEQATSSGTGNWLYYETGWSAKWGEANGDVNSLRTMQYNGSDGSFAVTSGHYYTFNFPINPPANSTNYTILETSAQPVTFSNVTQAPAASNVFPGQSVTVTITANNTPCSEEKVYVRYSTNDFATSSLALASFSGSTGTATIPALSGTVKYYVFSTTVSSPTANYDWLTLNYNNNGGSNYSYTVNSAWITTQDGAWSSASTWQGGIVPGNNQPVTIAHNVSADQEVVVSSAVINSGKTLTIDDNKNFTTTGSFTVNGSMTVNGNFKTAAGVFNANNITVNGNAHILGGGYFSGSPTYGNSSILYYSTYGSYDRSDEWTSATSGAGCPHNVHVTFTTTLNMGNSAALCTGFLTIIGGSTVNAPTNKLTIEGDLNLYGHMNIGVGSKVTVAGTLSNSAGATGLVVEAGTGGFGSLIEHSGAAATVQSYFSGSKWHFISAPVAGAVSGLFTGKFLQKFTESTNSYSDITSITEPLTPGVGFALWGDEGGFTTSYTGNLNHGTVSRSLARTTTGNNSGWNLVGNPYPSVIDWDAASGWTKTNLNDAIYIEKGGLWASYISGTGTNGGSQYIAPGQGFFVGVNAVGSGTLAMNDNVRVHDNTTFFKSDEIINLARLQVSGNGYTDDAVVRFLPGATNDFDSQFDAHKLFGYIDEAAEIYTGSGDPIVINSLVPETNSIPLGIRAMTSGTYTISASELVNVPVVTLEDLKTGIYTDLVAGPYTFNFESGEDEMRFMLYFGTTSVPETGTGVTNIYSLDQTVYVDLSKQEKGEVFIYNLSGQLVQHKPSASGLVNIGLNTTGIYVVKVVAGNTTLTKKVWIR